MGLYRSDGSAGGTTLLKSFATSDAPQGLYAAGGRAYFSAISTGTGRELWTSDLATSIVERMGTYKGLLNKYNRIGDVSSVVIGNSLFFADGGSASSSNYGAVWRSDGTAAGTVRIRAVNTAAFPSPIAAMTMAVGGKLIYSDATYLWRSDGTPEGTVHIDLTGISPDGVAAQAHLHRITLPGDRR